MNLLSQIFQASPGSGGGGGVRGWLVSIVTLSLRARA